MLAKTRLWLVILFPQQKWKNNPLTLTSIPVNYNRGFGTITTMKIHKNKHYPWANHCIISLRTTPLNPKLLLLLETNSLYCILLATSSRRLNNLAIVGYVVSQRFLDDVTSRLPDSRYPNPPLLFCWNDSINCLFLFGILIVYGGKLPARIWATGSIFSSHLRIQLPRFRPISMSLRCTSRWTFSVASNTVRVFLLYNRFYNRIK